ncbi:MAG TPA: gephyrin-like molybdotransferase Glp [Candidatus Tectomicrobia bacterium]|nr:gephyrin-like molybdotransferase Glp [Candidatus Tectomicrobia bacterium]
MPMLTVDEAATIILNALQPLSHEIVAFAEAPGRVLAADIVADAPVPLFAQSAMDGFAVRSADTLQAIPDRPVVLKVLGTLGAGHQTSWTVSSKTTVRIMTGAPIPQGADAVVKREDTEFDAESVRISHPVLPHDHIIPPGRDIGAGTTLLRAGDVLTSWGIGICASVGKTRVSVYQRPRVGILALGDELVSPHTPPAPGQVRVSNLYAITAAVTKYGGQALNLGIAGDRLDVIEDTLRQAGDVDLLLTVGGSQRGDFDLVDDLLSGTRGHITFRDVAANYVRSMIFGRFGQTPLCGLPGSPIASFVTFEAFVRAALWKLAGRRSLEPVRLEAQLQNSLPPTRERTHFQPVWVEAHEEGLIATPLHVQKASEIPPQTLANGLIRRPPESPARQVGERVWVDIIEAPLPARSGVVKSVPTPSARWSG